MDTINLQAPRIEFRGEYRAVLRNPDESIVYDSGWQKNLITTRGEFLYTQVMSSQRWYSYCYVGSDGTAPAYSDTQMGNSLGLSNNVVGTDPTGGADVYNGGSPNYERWKTNTYRFNAGVGTGTIREMGIGMPTGVTAQYLFSHHLLDTPVVKASNQILDVSYRITIWPSLITTTATPVLIGGVNYTCETSFYNATITIGVPFTNYLVNNASGLVYSGDAAALTDATPAGSEGSSGFVSQNSEATGSMNVSTFYELTEGNVAGGIIRTAVFSMTNGFNIQTQFDALDGPAVGTGIPKDGTFELTLNWTLTWGERP